MSFEVPGAHALDDTPCRYGASKLLVRGPSRDLEQPYLSFLGGSETYGKFVEKPFAALTEAAMDIACVNLGCVNAGVDAFVNDPDLLEIAGSARFTVIQVMGAQNLTNRYYRVHPRRNDRFLEASTLLKKIYSDVDFTEFHFNRHLLSTLHGISPERFRVVREDLQDAWVARMRILLGKLGPRTALLWLRHEGHDAAEALDTVGAPCLVTRAMLDELRGETACIVEIPVRTAGRAGELAGMQFGPLQAPAAEQTIGPETHSRIAAMLANELPALL
ncbi:DUF6473 family protein [Sedimentitalea sp. JM2-8]|uniref:DUF6473 family protein n=1 Tax=Sedimentitalea xiamensis TaxID=3050037 RepID=A0ABT7FAV6_9RHOB|nr:DUF6473 family protein [Sedimentitalea xiamensis]MDK3072110.1 DUF6473 family protein [Sedimentitalea xiamensis]